MKKFLLFSFIGLWLVVAPGSLGYSCSVGGASDFVSGCILILLGLLSWKLPRKWVCIGAAVVGVWLQFAPLVFWEPKAVVYLIDTVTSVLLLILSAFFAGFYRPDDREESPSGWSFNPSAWGPRVVTVSFAAICWFLARYLACYQLGYIDHMRDPFFGDGTVKVITSTLSKQFPVPDAGLGAVVYTVEFLLGWMGGTRRWKTMPWLSVLFGAMVVPAGLVSILLIVSQPILVGAWCGICLMIAVCMLIMLVLTVPEVFASVQLLRRKTGKDFWRTFWRGDAVVESLFVSKPFSRRGLSSVGISFPANLTVSILLGLWLMCAPALFGIASPGADSDYFVGPLLVAFSVLSLSEVARPMRFVNSLLGAFLLSTPLWLEGFSQVAAVHNAVVGILIIFLSLRRGIIRERYGR